MALLYRIYFNAVFGALGGLLGWLMLGIFCDQIVAEDNSFTGKLVLSVRGVLVGGAIGYFVVSVEALRDRSLLRFFRLAAYGVLLGILGGAVGHLIGDIVNRSLVGQIGADRQSGGVVFGTMLARGLGWTFLGVAIGLSEGIAARSLGKLSYGAIGGAIGGFVGGALFGLAYPLTQGGGPVAAAWLAIGLMILGASIGALSALVQGVFQPASVKVMRGWQEGREYPLDKNDNLLGRDEHADIALFRDMRVEKKHAFIQREGQRYLLRNNGAPADFTLVNDQRVPNVQELHDGDRIQLGNVLLRFQARAAQSKHPKYKARHPKRGR
jgi:Inner membrane component of T3SS, cytoplasmic domain